ncbi:hypothetical protein J1614_000687 [Plenodomus biglobosus]|nr:hypothetical protein J1614_000687 [Plenodomus biglobosus]
MKRKQKIIKPNPNLPFFTAPTTISYSLFQPNIPTISKTTMKFSTATLSTTLLATIATAAPPALDARQSGGYYVAVGNWYSGPGCTASTLIFADPIFGNGNVCQPLDRSGTNPPIVSYSTVGVAAGCSGKSSYAMNDAVFLSEGGHRLIVGVVTLYTGAGCSGTAYSAPVGGCVTGSGPFVSTYVTCV